LILIKLYENPTLSYFVHTQQLVTPVTFLVTETGSDGDTVYVCAYKLIRI